MKIIIISILISMGVFFNVASVLAVPFAPSDDNGHESFVRQVLPKLLGRKPKGTLEVKLLTDIIKLHGREAMLKAVMEKPEFNALWTVNIIDHLEMQRETGSFTQSKACFGETNTANAVGKVFNDMVIPPEQLAEFVRDSVITASYPNEFTMFELIDSSISLDNLYPVYRSYIFPLTARRKEPGNMTNAAGFRAIIGSHFDRVYLDRDMDCIGCHRGTYSTTGIGNRTHPLYQSLDLTMFDQMQLGENIPDIGGLYDQLGCQNCHGLNGSGTSTATGILDASVSSIKSAINNIPAMSALYETDLKPDQVWQEEDLAQLETLLQVPGSFGNKEIGNTAEKHYAVFRRDLFPVDDKQTKSIDESGYEYGFSPWGMDKSCGMIANNFTVISDGPEASFFAGVNMGAYATILDVDASLQQGYATLDVMVDSMAAMDSDGQTGAVAMDGNVAFAYMVAAKITQNIWEQLMGEPLTIANHFSRNAKQRNLHQYLTEEIFIKNDWSLKETILAILTSQYFNRHAPVSSLVDTAYALPPVFDPFVTKISSCLVDDRRDGDGSFATTYKTTATGSRGRSPDLEPLYTPDCRFNSQGDVVHRFSPRELISSVSSALNWPRSTLIFGTVENNKNYPDGKLNQGIGQYGSTTNIGFKEVTLQSLLIWDESYGTCSTPDNISNNAIDWLQRLRDEIDVFNTANADKPLTLGEVVLTVKDWLIQEPVFGGYRSGEKAPVYLDIVFQPPTNTPELTESALVQSLFGMNLLNPVTSDSIDENKLRQLCGVYLRSPQFMLAGLIRNDTYNAPRLRVCNTSDCSYKEMCGSYANALDSFGFNTICSKKSVSKPIINLIKVSSG